MRILLAKARKYADQIVAEIAPMCDRIEIAGSVRRERPMCGDIDLVVLPKPGQTRAITKRCKRRVHAVTIDGDINVQVVLLNMVKLDLFIAHHASKDLLDTTPCNWGTLLLCRTGSKKHNIWFATRAKAMGFGWNPYHGLYRNGRCVAAATEDEMFSTLNMEWIPPKERER